ncbi:Uu.00g013540.m01.CDS01 [Anthostomella pinea]|uniref:Uu.00g013540.m01.CDS01 n=1 Tax=Anthostomella pinea TaxID=933095 RepID=A0AAI8YQB2_9PEZI|nr:Uu.00g013540.m01.CDS01 [Anthostomella pinea]
MASTSVPASTSGSAPAAAEPCPLRCTICNADSAKACTTCKPTAYCSKAFQKVDWPSHKLLRAQYAELTSSNNTASQPEGRILDFLFPALGANPELVYVPDMHPHSVTDEAIPDTINTIFDAHDDAFVLSHVRASDHHPNFLNEVTNKVRGYRKQESLLEVWYRKYGGHRPNEAVRAALTVTGGSSFHVWKGNVLVLAATNTHGRGVYKDVTMRDFRDAVDFLADYLNPRRREDELTATASMEWGVDMSRPPEYCYRIDRVSVAMSETDMIMTALNPQLYPENTHRQQADE